MRLDKKRFFDAFRPYYKKKTGKRALPASVVSGVDFLLDQFSTDSRWSDVRHTAYAFATLAHETAWTFQPIKEYRAKAGTKGRANQDRYWLSGYYGRGYVQLTWLANYKKAGQKLGIDLVGNPALALTPDVAFKVLASGMHEGWFTGKKLSTYINSKKKDYKGARYIINGQDKAATIAQYAEDFEDMLQDAKTNAPVEPTQPVEPEPLPIEPIDGEEAPKPGEAAPEVPAQEGEAVVGGRPGDAPIPVEKTEPAETSGWGTWVANIRAQWAALGISSLSFGSIFSGAVTNPTLVQWLIILGVAVIVIGGIIFLVAMILKHQDKRRREDYANQQTLKQLEIAADPTKYNVKLVG